jgi:hypothetical protein
MHTLTEDVGFYAQLPDHERQNCFIQQDGATCYKSRDSMARVHEADFKWDNLYYVQIIFPCFIIVIN